ncbi:MAG TPA: bifunctional DNA-binding transcriptional regulator/O6-methylguanine-DNA methyltransferase Ada [Gemmatimonadaceae bacterium]|nr:bifunctional DNA-binding transcriptional regulator/O6-methylguanine-DNA methyltransferase Ada [Gemmatimonadaceae bacterium]
MTPARATTAAQDAPPLSDAAAWRAVLARDARYDDRFVFAVSSTGIFCRPSCPARRPRREHVRFLADARAAERAGYRACKRCRPASAGPSRADQAVQAACAWLESHVDVRVTLAELARRVGMSPHHLQRTFVRAVGVSPREYQDALRRRHFTQRLRAGDTVSKATFDAGYGSSSRVYGRRAVRTSITPAQVRRGAPGAHITFTITACSLGRLLVAGTDVGVCAVALGDSDQALERSLRADFPRAEISRAGRTHDAWVAAVVALVDGRASHGNLPLDVRGTAFQWKVWKALQRIPRGRTLSYGELAAQLGQPTAARAVARACATNPVALVIPCHRVVRGSGALGGYRWGVERKARLLEAERER